jgi:hypothetical protein
MPAFHLRTIFPIAVHRRGATSRRFAVAWATLAPERLVAGDGPQQAPAGALGTRIVTFHSFIAPEMSRVAAGFRSVGVLRGASPLDLRPCLFFASIAVMFPSSSWEDVGCGQLNSAPKLFTRPTDRQLLTSSLSRPTL